MSAAYPVSLNEFDFDPFSWANPNLCAVCLRQAYGSQNGVPSYLCARCFATYGEAFVEHEPWIYWLYRQEHARRRRRTRRLQFGMFFEESLEMREERLQGYRDAAV